ncbi:2,4-dichlorophenol 6-monooxygenase, partial [Salmonella enterica subsp. enterica serovar Typhi]|nr:2,4-dichlorophenol 6-monooxygenase [Salmonella enterica subsp. enterica serovar Typhi]
QIVTRANKSIEEFGPIFKALGLLDSIDPVKMQSNMDARCNPNEAGEAQRKAIREAIAAKIYEFDAHGVEMNQRYKSGAIQADGQKEPAFEKDAELHFQQTTWPGARLPHAWVYGAHGEKASTLDLSGHGKFTVLTGIRGQDWVKAAQAVGKKLGVEIVVHVIGPRQKWQDLGGDWARASEIEENGAVLVRPDHHVAWRAKTMPANTEAELRRVLKDVLALA